jgi:hypothetical protein
MGRELVIAEDILNRRIVVTTHLESPMPPNFYIRERQLQLRMALAVLDNYRSESCAVDCDVFLAGDMNWTESRPKKKSKVAAAANSATGNKKRNWAAASGALEEDSGDGAMDLPSGWKDAWRHFKDNQVNNTSSSSSGSGDSWDGNTFDMKNNLMIKGTFWPCLQARFDRCLYQSNSPNSVQVC